MNFERIYNECNQPAKNKPFKSFKEIYFECNVKPLSGQALREMAAVNADSFSKVLTNKINEKIEKWRSHNREIINEKQLSNEIANVVNEIVKRNDTADKPFAIKTENCLLAYTENYANILRQHYPEYTVSVDIEAINSWMDIVLKTVVDKNSNYKQARLIDTEIRNIIKTSFLELNRSLPLCN